MIRSMVVFAGMPKAGPKRGDDAIVIDLCTHQVLWVLVDAAPQTQINLMSQGETFDLLA